MYINANHKISHVRQCRALLLASVYTLSKNTLHCFHFAKEVWPCMTTLVLPLVALCSAAPLLLATENKTIIYLCTHLKKKSLKVAIYWF